MKNKKSNVRNHLGKAISENAAIDALIGIDVILEQVRYRHLSPEDALAQLFNKFSSDN